MSRKRENSGNRIPRWWGACIVLATAAVLIAPSAGHARSEDQIKAAFLLNFARYVEWPDTAFSGADAPIRICTVDDSAFNTVIEKTIAGKIVGSRGLTAWSLDLEALTPGIACHILYVGPSDSAAAKATTTTAFSEATVFTIANDTGFAQRGGVANFFRKGNKIRFEINPKAANRAGLKISSRLLRLARIVE